MPRYALAIFDFDGTLADSFPWFVSALDQTADRFGLDRVKKDEIESLRDLSSRDALTRLGVPMLKLPAIATFMRRLMAESIGSIPLFKGVPEAIATLHAADMRLAIVSSNAEANIRGVLGPVADLVDHYACGSSLWGKPAKFRSVLNTLQIGAAETIAVGDEIRDIEAARKARLDAASVTFGYNSRAALAAHKPAYLFDDYDSLVETFLG
jgi:phosphoglycolate phosphatase